jgi:hypothetical protein
MLAEYNEVLSTRKLKGWEGYYANSPSCGLICRFFGQKLARKIRVLINILASKIPSVRPSFIISEDLPKKC